MSSTVHSDYLDLHARLTGKRRDLNSGTSRWLCGEPPPINSVNDPEGGKVCKVNGGLDHGTEIETGRRQHPGNIVHDPFRLGGDPSRNQFTCCRVQCYLPRQKEKPSCFHPLGIRSNCPRRLISRYYFFHPVNPCFLDSGLRRNDEPSSLIPQPSAFQPFHLNDSLELQDLVDDPLEVIEIRNLDLEDVDTPLVHRARH